jgi:hypothetical protein
LAAPRVHHVYLHAVPQPELGRLRRLVEVLMSSHEIVSYSRAVELVKGGRVERPTVAFSFDDAFASNLAASRVLDEYGISGCFFVPTGFVGTDSVHAARKFFGTSSGVDEPALSWSDLEAMVERGHEVGSHTATHRVLSELSADQAAEEIGVAREVLVTKLGRCDHFAWPRGRFHHMTQAAVRDALACGHSSVASAERGAHHPDAASTRPCLHREHVMTAWPLRHDLYFLGNAPAVSGAWPVGWDVS